MANTNLGTFDEYSNMLDRYKETAEIGPVVPKYVIDAAKQCYKDLKKDGEAIQKKLRFGFGFASEAKENHDNKFSNDFKKTIETFFLQAKEFINNSKNEKSDIKDVNALVKKIKEKMRDLFSSGVISSVISIDDVKVADDKKTSKKTSKKAVKESYEAAEKSLSKFKKECGKTSLTIRSDSMKNLKNKLIANYKIDMELKLGMIVGLCNYYIDCSEVKKIEEINKRSTGFLLKLEKDLKADLSLQCIEKDFTKFDKSLVVFDLSSSDDKKIYKDIFVYQFNNHEKRIKEILKTLNTNIEAKFIGDSGAAENNLEEQMKKVYEILNGFSETINSINDLLNENTKFAKQLKADAKVKLSPDNKKTIETLEKNKKIVEKNSFQLSLLDKSGGDEGVRKNIGEYREIYNSVATIFEYLKAYLTTFQNPTSTYKMLDASVTNLKDVDGKIDGIEKTLKNINEGKSNFSMENPNKLIKESAKSYKKMLKELEKIQKIESDVKTELEEFKKNNTIKRKIIRGVGKGLKFTTIFLSVVSNVSRIFAGDYSAVATLSMSMERFWEELAK